MTTEVPINLPNKQLTAYEALTPKNRLITYMGFFVYTFWPMVVAAFFELAGTTKGGFINLSGILYLLAFVFYTGPAILISIIALIAGRWRSRKETIRIFVKLNVLAVFTLGVVWAIGKNMPGEMFALPIWILLFVDLVAIYFIVRKCVADNPQEVAKKA